MLSQFESYHERGIGYFLFRIKILDKIFDWPIIILYLLPVRHAERPGRGYFFEEGLCPPNPS